MSLAHRTPPGTEQDASSQVEPFTAAAGPAPAAGSAHAREGGDWRTTLLVGGITLVLLIAAHFILGALVPRWWSQRVGSAVNGDSAMGTALGLFIGFAFTLFPLFVLTFALRPRTPWAIRATYLKIGLILALPNLCTLGTETGIGGAALAGRRTMDLDAPAFSGASLAGALIAAGVYLAGVLLFLRRSPVSHLGAGPAAGVEPEPEAAPEAEPEVEAEPAPDPQTA
jgi:hypothetical protein